MSRPHRDDRGLAALARVREVRETDSRIGLQRVLAEEAAVRSRLSSLESVIDDTNVPAVTTTADLVAARTRLAQAGLLLEESRADAANAHVVSADARARWITERARLAAVQHLLERRAAHRRTEAERRSARDADDLAAQRWSRGRS